MNPILPKPIGIMAIDPNGVIGSTKALNKHGLLWNYPGDLAHFQQNIIGHVLVMGSKTFEVMPQKILNQSYSIVFSRNKDSSYYKQKKVQVVKSLEEYFALDFDDIIMPECNVKVFMIGGAEIAKLFLQNNLMDEFILTRIHKLYDGDVRIDLRYFDGWNEKILERDNYYTIVSLQRKNYR